MRFVIAIAFAVQSLSANVLENEALALRRIADFWEEGEYKIAKSQMESFLEEFAESPYKNVLSTALGDLFLREKNYQSALNYYAKVEDPTLNDKVFLHRMQCLYHLEWHATLADECEAYLNREESDPAHRLEATYLLAIALYSQALDPQKEPQALIALAERAKPYFEELSHSELSEEVAGAFAHLQCILKDYPAASQIYLDLAEKSGAPESYLFQAALIQSKYNPALALETFDRLAKKEDGELAKEAYYNLLILYFEQGRYEEIIADKEKFFASIPPEKKGLCSLFMGQSYLQLKKYREGAAELTASLDNLPEDRLKSALLFLVEAAYHSEQLDLLDVAIKRLSREEQPKALFCRALLLKKQGKLEEAKGEMESLLAQGPFAERDQVLLELVHLHFEQKEWKECREGALLFLKEFDHESVWQLLLAASNELGDKRQFISDLEKRLEKATHSEQTEWIFRLAKAHFEIGEMEKAIELLTPILENHGDAKLLFAFSLRDGRGDEENFCLFAEQALSTHSGLLSLKEQHIALFNSYLKQNKLFLAADHLYAALLENGEVQSPNLYWLADHFYERYEKDPTFVNAAFDILSRIPETPLEEGEPFLLKLAKLHCHLGRGKVAQEILEKLEAQYGLFPEVSWQSSKEVRHFLAELYLDSKNFQKAGELFEKLASSESYHDRFSASAALQSVRLMRSELDFEKGVSRLKNLVLQKKLKYEPIYLEAGLDYIDLVSRKDPSKRLSLLQKMKANFESEEDLLAKDYHLAFKVFPEQAKLYHSYMRYLEAAILAQEKSLHTKAKELLLQIKEEADEPLLSRVESLLNTI